MDRLASALTGEGGCTVCRADHASVQVLDVFGIAASDALEHPAVGRTRDGGSWDVLLPAECPGAC